MPSPSVLYIQALAGSGLPVFSKPPGTNEGDLFVIVMFIDNTNTITHLQSLDGFTEHLREEDAFGRLISIWSKVATATEPTEYEWSWTGSFASAGGIFWKILGATEPFMEAYEIDITNGTTHDCPRPVAATPNTTILFHGFTEDSLALNQALPDTLVGAISGPPPIVRGDYREQAAVGQVDSAAFSTDVGTTLSMITIIVASEQPSDANFIIGPYKQARPALFALELENEFICALGPYWRGRDYFLPRFALEMQFEMSLLPMPQAIISNLTFIKNFHFDIGPYVRETHFRLPLHGQELVLGPYKQEAFIGSLELIWDVLVEIGLYEKTTQLLGAGIVQDFNFELGSYHKVADYRNPLYTFAHASNPHYFLESLDARAETLLGTSAGLKIDPATIATGGHVQALHTGVVQPDMKTGDYLFDLLTPTPIQANEFFYQTTDHLLTITNPSDFLLVITMDGGDEDIPIVSLPGPFRPVISWGGNL